jgi:hypothetical protein
MFDPKSNVVVDEKAKQIVSGGRRLSCKLDYVELSTDYKDPILAVTRKYSHAEYEFFPDLQAFFHSYNKEGLDQTETYLGASNRLASHGHVTVFKTHEDIPFHKDKVELYKLWIMPEFGLI